MYVSLRDFFNNNNVASIFVAGNGCPAGIEYRQNLDGDGEDYCNLGDLIELGLFLERESGGESSAWQANGEVSGDGKVWRWDGEGGLTDTRGNNYTQVVLDVCK